jgi:hypothetical protein
MAFAGALIVLSGLAVLSFVLSQLHKIVALLEKRREPLAAPPAPGKEPAAAAPQKPALDLDTAREEYQPLVAEMDEPFELQYLYTLAKDRDLPHVHLTIRSLREAGIIVPVGEGKFEWQA